MFYHDWQLRGRNRSTNDGELFPMSDVPVDRPKVMKAGEIKAVQKIPYGDGLAASLASLQKAVLVSADHDFDKLGPHFTVLWMVRS